MNDESEVRLQQALALAQIGRFSDQLIPSGANRRQCEGRGDDEIMKGRKYGPESGGYFVFMEVVAKDDEGPKRGIMEGVPFEVGPNLIGIG